MQLVWSACVFWLAWSPWMLGHIAAVHGDLFLGGHRTEVGLSETVLRFLLQLLRAGTCSRQVC